MPACCILKGRRPSGDAGSWKLHSVRQRPSEPISIGAVLMGMIGFDIACAPTRSGPRMQGYLVNAPCEQITANKKQSDFALAA